MALKNHESYPSRTFEAHWLHIQQRVFCQIDAVTKVYSFAEQAPDIEDLIEYVESSISRILNSDILDSDKEFILCFLSAYHASLEFISEYHDIIIDIADKSGWWNRWGRCAAGITGGAIIGGFTGGAAASVIPGIGTTAGIIVGGIGGGLAGAASTY